MGWEGGWNGKRKRKCETKYKVDLKRSTNNLWLLSMREQVVFVDAEWRTNGRAGGDKTTRGRSG